MNDFSRNIKAIFLEKKGFDMDEIDYIDMPKSKDNYNLDKIIGNINLVEGRFMIKSEADEIINEFLTISLP